MAESNVQIVRTFGVGTHSIVLVVPKLFHVEKGTQFIATQDSEGRIVYEPLSIALREKAKN